VSQFFEPLIGLGRTMGRTAAALTLDAASGAVRLGEVAVDTMTGQHREPGVLRVQVLVLRDENGVPLCTEDAVEPSLRVAAHILREHAWVRVRVVDVRTVPEPAPAVALDPRANRGLMLDDVLGRTEFYRRNLPTDDPAVEPGLIGAPVTVIVVRNIAGHTTGCSLGMSADWVIAQAALFDPQNEHTYDETVLAHELGHALNLPHHRNRANLMFPESSPPGNVRGTDLTPWQRKVLQGNRHLIPGRSGGPADLG
jgi:hypothetical protein